MGPGREEDWGAVFAGGSHGKDGHGDEDHEVQQIWWRSRWLWCWGSRWPCDHGWPWLLTRKRCWGPERPDQWHPLELLPKATIRSLPGIKIFRDYLWPFQNFLIHSSYLVVSLYFCLWLIVFYFFPNEAVFYWLSPPVSKARGNQIFSEKIHLRKYFCLFKEKSEGIKNLEPGLRVWHGIVFGFTCWSGRSQLQCHLEKLSPLGNSGLLHPGFSEIFRNIHNIRNIDNIHTQTHTVDLKFSFLIISCSPSAKINSAWGKVLIARPNTFTSFNNSLKSVWFLLDKLLFFCLKKLLYFLKASGFCLTRFVFFLLEKLLYFLKSVWFLLDKLLFFFAWKSCCIF